VHSRLELTYKNMIFGILFCWTCLFLVIRLSVFSMGGWMMLNYFIKFRIMQKLMDWSIYARNVV
jgi:hypothetical protein